MCRAEGVAVSRKNLDNRFESASFDQRSLLPEWGELDIDDAAWIAALEQSRRQQFAELANL